MQRAHQDCKVYTVLLGINRFGLTHVGQLGSEASDVIMTSLYGKTQALMHTLFTKGK